MGTCIPSSASDNTARSTLTRLRRLLLAVRRSSAVKCASAMTVDIPKGSTSSTYLGTASTNSEPKSSAVVMSNTNTDSSQKDTEEDASIKDNSLVVEPQPPMQDRENHEDVLVKVKKFGVGPVAPFSPDRFHFLMPLGEGSYSTVYLCKDGMLPGDSIPRYAVKVITKAHVVRYEMVLQLCREMKVLEYLSYGEGGFPFIPKLFGIFQDQDYIYIAMNVCERGTLTGLMKGGKKLDVESAKFYAAEIVAALSYIHRKGVTHRDVKPDNILLTMDGHINLTDFGSCSIHDHTLRLDSGVYMHPPRAPRIEDFSDDCVPEEEEEEPMERQRRSTFVGTAQYVSPEMLRGDKVGPECDLWAFGCILYQMLAGCLPFKAMNDYHLMKRISATEFSVPEGFDPEAADLVKRLLTKNPEDRISAEKIKTHRFFKDMEWEKLSVNEPPTEYTYMQPKYDRLNEPAYFSKIPTGYSSEIAARLIDSQLRRDAEEFQQLIIEPMPIGNFDFSDDIEAPDDCIGSDAMQELMKKTREQRVKKERLRLQEESNLFHQFCKNQIIIKQGIVEKRKGVFARARMFVLTEGPRLFYVKQENMEFKGEIPFSPHMTCEVKDFRIFHIHTPRRVYYLTDPDSRALDWSKTIMETKRRYETQLQEMWDNAVRMGIWPAVDINKKKLRNSEKERLKEVKRQAKLKAEEEKRARKAEKLLKK